MKIQRMLYKPKLRKLNLVGGVWYIENKGKTYILARTHYDSIAILRKATNYENKEPKCFYEIIHNNYIKQTNLNKQREISKTKYYADERIRVKENKIVRLQKEIKEEKIKLIELKNEK